MHVQRKTNTFVDCVIVLSHDSDFRSDNRSDYLSDNLSDNHSENLRDFVCINSLQIIADIFAEIL